MGQWESVFSHSTAWKVSKYGVFSGPYISAVGLNTYLVRMQKNPDRKNSVFGHFSLCSTYETSSNNHLKNQKHFLCILWLLNVGSYKFALPRLHIYQGKFSLTIFSKEISHLQVKSKIKFAHDDQTINNLLAYSFDHCQTSSPDLNLRECY